MSVFSALVCLSSGTRHVAGFVSPLSWGHLGPGNVAMGLRLAGSPLSWGPWPAPSLLPTCALPPCDLPCGGPPSPGDHPFVISPLFVAILPSPGDPTLPVYLLGPCAGAWTLLTHQPPLVLTFLGCVDPCCHLFAPRRISFTCPLSWTSDHTGCFYPSLFPCCFISPFYPLPSCSNFPPFSPYPTFSALPPFSPFPFPFPFCWAFCGLSFSPCYQGLCQKYSFL